MVFAAITCPTANIHRYPLGGARCASKVKRHNNNTATCVVQPSTTRIVSSLLVAFATRCADWHGPFVCYAVESCLHRCRASTLATPHCLLFTAFVRDRSCQNKPRAKRPTPQRPTPVRPVKTGSHSFSPAPIEFVEILVSRSNTLCALLQYVL